MQVHSLLPFCPALQQWKCMMQPSTTACRTCSLPLLALKFRTGELVMLRLPTPFLVVIHVAGLHCCAKTRKLAQV